MAFSSETICPSLTRFAHLVGLVPAPGIAMDGLIEQARSRVEALFDDIQLRPRLVQGGVPIAEVRKSFLGQRAFDPREIECLNRCLESPEAQALVTSALQAFGTDPDQTGDAGMVHGLRVAVPAEVIEINAFRTEFESLALERGNFSAEEIAKILTEFGPHPAFFRLAVKILRRFTFDRHNSHGGWKSAVTFVYISKNHTRVIDLMKETVDFEDKGTFNNVWVVLNGTIHSSEIASVPAAQWVERVKDIQKRFCALMGSTKWSEYKFFEIEVVLNHSSDPAHDLPLILDYKLHHSAKPEALTAYYEQGHHYICHPHFWGDKDRSSLDNDKPPKTSPQELSIRSAIAKLKKGPGYRETDVVVAHFLRLPNEQVREQMMSLLTAFMQQGIDLSHFTDMLQQLVGSDKTSPALAQNGNGSLHRILRTLPHLEGNDLVVALFILEDLLKLPEEKLASYVRYFEARDLAELEREIYRKKLQEHASRFPEKPIEEVRAAFETKEHPESETPPPEVLDDAFGLYGKILAAGQELIKVPQGEIMRRLKMLLAPFEAQRLRRAAERKKTTQAKHAPFKMILSGIKPEESPAEIIDVPAPEDLACHADFNVQFFALLRELFKREFGVYPYNTQLLAILLMVNEKTLVGADPQKPLKGIYEQIKTGEGKSLILALLSSYLAVQGRRVDLITSNAYLAKRDRMKFQKFYEKLNLSAGDYDHGDKGDSEGEGPDILYTTNESMIFGFLKSRLQGQPFFDESRFGVALVDEADNLCIDMARNSCRIADQAPSLFSEETLRRFLAYADAYEGAIAEDLPAAIADFKKDHSEIESIHPVFIGLYLQSAIRSKQVRLDEDFIIKDDAIVIVDVHNTGRIQKNMHWGQGLHEFVTLRNGLKLPMHFGVTAQMNHPTYLQKYDRIYCISGTFGDAIDREEIRDVYHMTGFDVPSHYPCRRVDESVTLVSDSERFFQLLIEKVRKLSALKRPILIVSSSVKESLTISRVLEAEGYRHQLLNDVLNLDEEGVAKDEETLIHRAGRHGMITIATSVAGRGADIIPDAEAVEAGGLHALLTFVPHNSRVEFQARGRAGRQGKPGSSEILASLDTDLYLRNLPDSLIASLGEMIRIYGERSSKVAGVIEFIRKCTHLMHSIERVIHLEKEELIDEAMNGYFRTLKDVTQTLMKRNRILTGQSEASGFLVSSYLSETWASEFDYVETVVRNDSIISISRPSEGLVHLEFTSGLRKKIERCFKNAFGIGIEEIQKLSDIRYRGFIETLFSSYGARLLDLQRRIAGFDKKQVVGLIRSLEEKVAKAADSCVARFEGATVIDINRYFEAKKKEREAAAAQGKPKDE